MNNCMFAGNLVKEVGIRDAKGTPVGEFTLAINERYKDKDGQWKDKEPSFLDFEIWGERAKYLADVTKNGTGLVVTCSAQQDRWEDKETGGKRSKVKFRVNDFKVTTIPSRNGSAGEAEGEAEQQPPAKNTSKKQKPPAGDEEIPF
jgi:single-strand DNA-binding protein